MSTRPVWPGAALLCCVVVSSAWADEVQIRNGDRLTGTAVALSGGKLSFKTSYGEVVVPWNEVTALRLDKPMLVTTTGGEPRQSTLDGIALADVVALATEQPAIVVSGGASAGWLAAGGNTHVNSIHADGQVVARRKSDRFTTGGVINRADDDGRQTARNATGSFNYDRFFDQRLFANSNLIITNDTFRGLDLRMALGAGLGYEAWKSARSTLSVEGGLGYVRENLADAPTTSYAAAREAIRLIAQVVDKQVQVFHNHDGYFGVTGDDNLFFRMQNGLRFALVAGLVSTLQLDVDYDRSPAPGRKTTDRTTSLTFGYRF
jgi:putative salt-induced outer membrane protein YdiY